MNTYAFAQYGIKELPLYEKFRLVKLNYENASGEKAFSIFEYNTEGFLISAKWHLKDNSRSGIISYKYDDHGNIIEKFRTFSDSITIMQTFKYTESSKLLIDNFNRSDGTIGLVKYNYAENGDLINAICDKQNGWFTGVINFEYAENGKITKGNLLQNNNVIGTITYSYDQFGMLKKEYWDFPERWNQTFIYEYKKI